LIQLQSVGLELIFDHDEIRKPGITVALSGYFCGDALSFWKAFIEIQAKLPKNKVVRQIVAHSFNPELAEMINLAYAPQVIEYDEREMFCAKYFQQINLGFFSALQDDHAISAIKNKKLPTALINAYSRASAIRLINSTTSAESQILMVYWDLKNSSSDELNQIITDTSLPANYLYLSYSSDVDLGYSDAWILAPWDIVRRFRDFDQFALDAFTARNNYLELFAKTGWLYSERYTYIRNFLSYWFDRKPRSTAIKIVRYWLSNLEGNLKGDNFFRKIARRFLRPIYNVLIRPPVTLENSCLADITHSRKIPRNFFFNIRPLLKYFILFHGLRDRVRFLTKEDFEIVGQSGQVINPQKIILIICESDDSSLQMLAHSPLQIAAVYQLSHGLVREHLPDHAGNWTQTIFHPFTNALKDQIDCALEAAERHNEDSLPVLLTLSVHQFLKCADWFYLNALMKYIVWKELDYVELNSAATSNSRPDFPDLYMMQSDIFSLLPSAGSVAGIRTLLDNLNTQLESYYKFKGSIKFEFPAVSRVGNLFINLE
jgi:hypothetical protein